MTLFIGLTVIGLLGPSYILVGYPLLLATIVCLKRISGGHLELASWERPEDHKLPNITVAISAFNEGDIISRRIANLLETDYPCDKLEIFVVSDGSTDSTADEVLKNATAYPDYNIRLHVFAENLGRSAAYNYIHTEAFGEIMLYTDAETAFERGTIRAMAAAFVDPKIGVVGAEITYRSTGEETSFNRLYSYYRAFEYAMRRAETRLGVGCKTDGPATAGRRTLWQPLLPFEDVDQSTQLYLRAKGYRTVHVSEACAFDVSNNTSRQELRQRRRMTRKGLLSFAASWSWAYALAYPGFTAAYVSHKILRYFLPVFALVALIGALGIAGQSGVFGPALLALVTAFLISGVGARLPKVGRLLGLPYSLLISNLAYLLGIWDAFMRRAGGTYVPTRAVKSSKS